MPETPRDIVKRLLLEDSKTEAETFNKGDKVMMTRDVRGRTRTFKKGSIGTVMNVLKYSSGTSSYMVKVRGREMEVFAPDLQKA